MHCTFHIIEVMHSETSKSLSSMEYRTGHFAADTIFGKYTIHDGTMYFVALLAQESGDE